MINQLELTVEKQVSKYVVGNHCQAANESLSDFLKRVSNHYLRFDIMAVYVFKDKEIKDSETIARQLYDVATQFLVYVHPETLIETQIKKTIEDYEAYYGKNGI